MVELFNSPRELSHSAPDLVHKSVFSHKYDDQGEPTLSHETQQAHPTTPMNKARRQQTPRDCETPPRVAEQDEAAEKQHRGHGV